MWGYLSVFLKRGRLLALLLAAVLLCGSVSAFAGETEGAESVPYEEPQAVTELPAPDGGETTLPEDAEEVAPEAEMAEPSAPQEESDAPEEEPSAPEEVPQTEEREAAVLAGTYVSYNEAVEQLRAGLVARESSVTVYMELFYAPMGSFNSNMLEKAMEHTGNPKEGDYIRMNMSGCRYSCDYYVENGSYYVTYTATPNWLSTAAQEAEVDAAVEELLAQLDLYGLPEYEKIVGVYDYITEYVQYDFDNYDDPAYMLKYSTYAAMIHKVAVCQGYASLLYRLLLEVGVDCRCIIGTADNESHAWNIIQLEGAYYNADPTWDRDLKGHYRNFLCNESNFGDHRRDSKYNTTAFHAAYPMADTSYIVGAVASGTLSNGMTWVLDDEACLTVTGTGAIPAFRNWDPPWDPYRDSVKSIVLSEGITEVGDRAFAWCKNATSVTLPDSLTVIREYGFNNLRSLNYIDLPPNLRVLEHCAFSECAGLQEIILPDSVTTVESSCFSNNPGLKRAVLSAGMTHVPNSMFFNDTALREVVLPDSITSIGDTAFNSCGGLRTFTIPAHLTSLGSSVFAGCSSLTHFYVAEGNPVYRDFDGVLCSADGKTLISCPAGRNGTYTVPEGITTIARSAFGRAYYLDKVILPDSLTRIEDYAFSWCEDLDSITIGRNVQFVDDSAFRGCRTMTSVTFLSDDTVLDDAVFADCDYLVSVDLPDNLKEIPYGLFYDCASIMSIDFPPGVTSIGSSAFLDCDWLTRVTVPGTVKTVGRQAFDYCNLLSVLIFEPGVQRIEDIAIRNMPILWKVEIPPSVTYIGRDNFENCPDATIYGYEGSYAHQFATANGIPFVSTHTHRYTASGTVWPTCTEQGYTIYRCSCGDSYYGSYTAARGHTAVTDPAIPATCTASGQTEGSHCGVCGVVLVNRQMTQALGHSYGVWYEDVAPTCTTDGLQRRDCIRCEDYLTEPLPATGHTYDAVVTAPTCTEQGYTTYTCPACGDSYVNDYTAAAGHSLVAGICTVCGEAIWDINGNGTLDILLIGNSHTANYSEFFSNVLADMYADGFGTTVRVERAIIGSIGLYSGRNSNANATHRSQLEAMNAGEGAYKYLSGKQYDLVVVQDYMESAVDTPEVFAEGLAAMIRKINDTATENGFEAPQIAWFADWVDIRSTGGDTALRDGEGNKITLPKLTREQVYQKSLANIARIEAQIAEGEANMPNFVIHASTIKQNALSSYLGTTKLWENSKYCLLESDNTHLTNELGKYFMAVAVLSEIVTHYADSLQLGLSGTEIGKTLTVQNGPSESGEGSQYEGAVNEQILAIIREAISSPEQFKQSVYETDPIETFLNHVSAITWDFDAFVDEQTALNRIREQIAEAGMEVDACTVTVKQFNSVNQMIIHVRALHGYSLSEQEFELHRCIYAAVTTPPTCTEQGYTTHACSACGDSYVGDYVAALGHDEVIDPAVPPTCTESGLSEGKHCVRCGEVLVAQTELPAAGHSYEAAVTAPTCTEQGYTTHTCPCGDSYVDSYVAALGHDEVMDPAVPPTCTESGLSEGKHCARCGEVLVARTEIPATGHSYEATVTAPTCTEQGCTTYTCTVCADSYVADYVSAAGHSWVAGICGVCGHDSVEVQRADGSLRIRSDGLERGMQLYLAAYGEGGRFLSLTELIWQGGELEQRLPEGENWALLFLDNWRPLREEIGIE